jgi:soluble lytic murein transglycosylase-like protein
VLAILALCVLHGTAHAQIYVWRDANGTLVLSDRPIRQAAPARTYPVSGASGIRTTTPAHIVREGRYQDLIEHHSSAHGVRPDLVRAVIRVESAFNPRARSHKGAMGLMQLMPATAAEYGVYDAYDPAQNIAGGVAYLKTLLTRYGDNEELALAAYNAGPKAVDKYGERVPPYRETQAYVNKIKNITNVAAATTITRVGAIYRSVEVVNGREVVRYSNVPPSGSNYTIVETRR